LGTGKGELFELDAFYVFQSQGRRDFAIDKPLNTSARNLEEELACGRLVDNFPNVRTSYRSQVKL
jgi:hypothetical protein